MFDYIFNTSTPNKYIVTSNNDEPLEVTSNSSIDEVSEILELTNEMEKLRIQNNVWYSLIADLKQDLKFVKIVDNVFFTIITLNFLSLTFIKTIPLIPALLLGLSATSIFTKLLTIGLYGTSSKIMKKINYYEQKINNNREEGINLQNKKENLEEKINYKEISLDSIPQAEIVKDQILIRKLTK